MRILKLATHLLLISSLASCATKDDMLPVPDQDMQQVYDKQMGAQSAKHTYDIRSLLRRPMLESDIAFSQYVRTEKNQLQAKFKLLPNPMMYMFVAPHLATRNEVPIPGYLTEFKMYARDHFALPGEVSDLSIYREGQ